MKIDSVSRRLNTIERLAKDDSIPYKLLHHSLLRFIIDTNYFRTPYELYMPLLSRARSATFVATEEACLYFDDQDKIYYPDINKVKIGWGRCNGPHEAVFYCADENVIPMFEIKPNIGEYLILGNYRHQTLDKIKLSLPVIGVEQIVSSLLQRDPTNSLLKILADDMHYKQDIHPEVLEIDQHFARWFTQVVDSSNKHYYKLTTALYNIFTKNVTLGDDKERLIGLLYPSVASNITGVNIALETGFVDTNLRLLNAVMYKVESIDLSTNYFRLQPLKQLSRITEDGKLSWKDSAMINERLEFSPATPTIHLQPPPEFLDGIGVYEK